MHLPKHSLLFGIAIFLCLGLISFTFPEKGLFLGSSFQLNFPSPNYLFGHPTHKTDITKILEAIDKLDTTFVISDIDKKTENTDTLSIEEKSEKVEVAPNALNTTIQSSNGKALYSFFAALKALKNQSTSLRVLHYGDSQIEGDRITDYLRLKLQGQFGGEGPGLVSLTPITQSVINRIENAPGWDRYGTFTAKDKRVQHTNYGVLAGFSRYHAYKKIKDTSAILTSSVGITTTPLGGSNALNFKKIKLFYGGAKTKTWCEFYEGPALMGADSLLAGGVFQVKEYKVISGANKHVLKFRGKDSPDFYGISLEGDAGVMVDNIALRGSSGTFFHQINLSQLKQFYDYMNVKLIILQFGGNVMPSIEDASMAVNYGNYLRYQITMVKKAAPNASILFVGPSDMSIKDGMEYVTYPMLEKVRDEIRKAVLESGCAFFDMYDCMGGKNSMSAWVDQNLAATDYTHFSPQGARKMATMLYSALINDYNQYLKKIK